MDPMDFIRDRLDGLCENTTNYNKSVVVGNKLVLIGLLGIGDSSEMTVVHANVSMMMKKYRKERDHVPDCIRRVALWLEGQLTSTDLADIHAQILEDIRIRRIELVQLSKQRRKRENAKKARKNGSGAKAEKMTPADFAIAAPADKKIRTSSTCKKSSNPSISSNNTMVSATVVTPVSGDNMKACMLIPVVSMDSIPETVSSTPEEIVTMTRTTSTTLEEMVIPATSTTVEMLIPKTSTTEEMATATGTPVAMVIPAPSSSEKRVIKIASIDAATTSKAYHVKEEDDEQEQRYGQGQEKKKKKKKKKRKKKRNREDKEEGPVKTRRFMTVEERRIYALHLYNRKISEMITAFPDDAQEEDHRETNAKIIANIEAHISDGSTVYSGKNVGAAICQKSVRLRRLKQPNADQLIQGVVDGLKKIKALTKSRASSTQQ